MLKARLAAFNEPFPEGDSGKTGLLKAVYNGFFVAAFLFIFNPFNLQNMPLGQGLSSAVFGLITLFCMLSYQWLLKSVLAVKTDEPSWTLWKWVLSSILLLLWVAAVNFAFILYSFPDHFDWSDYPLLVQYTLMVGITPVVVSGMLIQMHASKRNMLDAESLSPVSHTANDSYSQPDTQPTAAQRIVFQINNETHLTLEPSAICAIEAMQNYVMVYYWDSKTQTYAQEIIRCTMAKAAELIAATSLFRCHRSYFVNLQKINSVSGNAQGLKLAVDGITDKEIPVSRTFVKPFKTVFSAQ